MTDEPTVLKFGSVVIDKPRVINKRVSLLLWGPSGAGKTTLAATAPGKKFWINFDPDGTSTLTNREDVIVADLSTQPNSIVQRFTEENPFRISKIIEEQGIDTVVVDSLTSFGDMALSHGVKIAQGTAKGRSSTIEDPGFSGFGNKNTWTRQLVMNMLQVTGKTDTNIIFIAHEDKPEKNDQGVVMYISIMLGSSLNEQLPTKISEIWNLTDTGKERRIAIRACRSRKPMKTRMFKTSGDPEFIWNYDSETEEGEGITDWHKQWLNNDSMKIELPK